ncbi:MAG: GGDEF domain-containing protein [Treponema sp.]|uniref:GGDEF domain-containing protein n=1 Tax=Treponema sp. TaxID=166 RepID=UPI00257E7BA7|nr:GGDEF domain-containing protein [Treponema sp.]MBQ5537604.1 GGDEF domain-containing protein [Treponema sp.]
MEKSAANGININFLNTFLTVLTAIVFLFTLLISGSVNKKFRIVQDAINKFIICEWSSNEIMECSNDLTEEARLFVITHKVEHAENYIAEITVKKRKEAAMAELLKVCSEKDIAYQRLKIAITQAESLINMELYAMRLAYELLDEYERIKMPERLRSIDIRPADRNIPADKIQELAVGNLFGDGYLIYKTRINENCKLTMMAIEQQIKEKLGVNARTLGSNIKKLRTLFIILLVMNLSIFTVLSSLVITPLKKFLHAIKNDEKLNIIGSTELRNLAISYNEIYEIKARNERALLEKAEYDALTGILNRRAFDQICATSTEKRQNIALVLVDMDNFKRINDTFGHSGGDTVLRSIATILRETFRKDDYVARIGGDEFAVILQNFKPAAQKRIIEKISIVNKKLAERLGDLGEVSISAGAAYSDGGYSDELYKNADKALYEAKESGRKTCRIYGEQSQPSS